MVAMGHKYVFGFVGVMMSLLLISPAASATEVVVYKSPTCECCKKWVKHMQDNGFTVVSKDVKDVIPYKIKYGVSPQTASCHTAVVQGYTIEGHVPAADVKRLLKQRPPVRGLAVPGMPVGTPGMEQGNRRDKYDVVTFDKQGKTTVFSSYK